GEIVEYTIQRLVEIVSAFEDDEFLDIDFAKMEIESIWIEYHNELVSALNEQEAKIEEELPEPVAAPAEEQKANRYLPSFIFECKQLLVGMGDNLEKVVDGDRSDETFFELYRLAHSIGSSALTVELTEVADIARNMESALEVYGEENPPQWDVNLAPVIEYTALKLTEIITALEADEIIDIDSIKTEIESIWTEYKKEESSADKESIFISNEEEMIEESIEATEKSSKSEELDSVVADFFKIEADEHLKTLQDGFLDLEKNPKDEKIIEEVFRAAHTLKGAASTVGFKSTEIASHAIEDTLEPIRDGEMVLSPDTIDVLLGSLDALVETYKLECDRDPKAVQAANEVAVVLGEITGRQVDSKPAETQVFFAKKKDHIKREESVNVRLSKLDSLMNLAGELLVQQSRMNETKIKFFEIAEAIRLSLRRLATLNSDLSQQQLMSRTTQAMRVGVNVDDRQDSKYSSEFDELELDRYNELDRIVKNESEVHADLVEALFGFEDEISELAGSTDNLMQNVSAIQSSVISTRLIPLTQILDRFPRMVRDLARSEKKLIDLQIFGEDVEIDITVLRSIFDPMLHLVRNAVHHGIETPEIREMIDKPKQGTISIDARYVGNQVVVEVSNDGISLDTGSIAAEALRMGIISDSDLEKMTDDQVNELIFLSGLSTSEEVGMVAGRGIGLDVVKNNIEAIGGLVSIVSTPDKTSFTLTLPISLVISQGIIVNISEHKFVVPLGSIQEVARIKKSDIEMIGSGPVVNLRGELLSIRYLDELLGIKSTIKNMPDFPALIIAKGSSLTVVAISSIEGRQDIMIKKLPVCLDNIPIYSGVSIFGSGRVYPVLNVPMIISDKHIKIEQTLSGITSTKDEELNVLVVEDSLSMRKILKMDLENAGYIIHTASTGLEALDVIENKHIDGIILDIEMPEMDGYELMSVLKDEKNLAKIPKMIITSRAGGKHREKAFALGADAYLVKPYDRSIVLETLKNLVSD
ncbi:MAG: Hpt domain-containing protein, partial [Caldisericia bacterium]|nr:Hpt domain-containing protein [Caldisericia bacterium]